VKLGAKSLDTKGRGVPFKFYTAYYVSTYSRKKAYTLRELLEGVKTADKNTLFHHVFHAVRAKHLLPPRYNNDFARWVGEEVGDEELAAALSDISGAEPATIEDIRKEIVAILEPAADERRGRSEFVFVGMEPVVVETKYVAHTLAEFLDLVEVVPGESILYHFVTRRVLRRGAERLLHVAGQKLRPRGGGRRTVEDRPPGVQQRGGAERGHIDGA